MGETYDRFNRAHLGLLVITALAIVAAVVLAASAGFDRRNSLEMTENLIKMLDLSTPTLFPTGHALRDVGYSHPAVDLRHSPYLPAVAAAAPENLPGSPATSRQDSQ